MSTKPPRRRLSPGTVPSVVKRQSAPTKQIPYASGPDIMSTWPDTPAVAHDEIDVIEQHLGDAIDTLLHEWYSANKKWVQQS